MIIQLRNDTAANWAAANSVLAVGEIGIEREADGHATGFKIGDGVTPWTDLPYAVNGEAGMTQAQADARYVQQSAIDQALGVAGLDADRFVGEDRLPLPPIDLTVLFENKLT